VAVGSGEVDPFAEHRDAAIDGRAPRAFRAVMPDLAAGDGVQREDLVGDGRVHHALIYQRDGFEIPGSGELPDPFGRQAGNVTRIDLGEGAMAPPGVIAVIAEPVLTRILAEVRVADLREHDRRHEGNKQESQFPPPRSVRRER
jgi:hypothetical protein